MTKVDPGTARGRTSLRRRQTRRFIAIALAPALVFLCGVILYPLATVIIQSFQDAKLVSRGASEFVGLSNFFEVFNGTHFKAAVWNTAVWTLGSVIGELIVGLATAVLLNMKVRGITIFRIAVFIPWLVPIVVAGMIWSWILNPNFGILNAWAMDLGLWDSPINFLGDQDWAMVTIVFINVWRSFPFYTISFLAAMQAIPSHLYEAAALDGAGSFRRFLHVTLPGLRSVILIIVFIHLIWTAVNFDFVGVLTKGGPDYATITLPILIYRYAMQQFDVGLASALSTLMLVATTVGFVVYYKMRTRLSREIVG